MGLVMLVVGPYLGAGEVLIIGGGHRWELPGNYRDFIEVMVFYLFCWITKRILVTAMVSGKIFQYTY